MPKTVHKSKFQEWRGLDRISLVVHEMKCIFREITKDDFGIDGEIEVVEEKPDGTGYQTTGGVIKVQAKSGMSYVKQDTPERFVSPVKKDDLETWCRANYSTVYIVYHPNDDKLYWKEVKNYVKNTPGVWQPPLYITFDKAQDEFSPGCFQSVRSLAPSSQSTRISFSASEQLFSNLLKIKRIPRVWSAPCTVRHYDDVRHSIQGFVTPFNVVADRIYSFSNLYEKACNLRKFCDAAKIHEESLDDWWDDLVLQRNYVFMLNQLLGIHLRSCGLRYNKKFSRNYFPRENEDDDEFKTEWYNMRTSQKIPGRLTAKHYIYGYDEFWRHLAANITFQRIGESWFLQIIPKYFFTEDGIQPWESEKVGEYTTRIKAQERNPNVLNHVLFWSYILTRSERCKTTSKEMKIMLDGHIIMIIERMPFTGVANFAIPFDPAIYEEPTSSDQLNFLGTLFELEEDDDDEF